jgi:hypothetical protein
VRRCWRTCPSNLGCLGDAKPDDSISNSHLADFEAGLYFRIRRQFDVQFVLGTMSSDKINLCDYAVAFVDLLGQKAEMPGRHLPDNKEEAVALVKKSVGKIVGTQKLFESFYESYSSGSHPYAQLPKHIQDQAPDMAPGELKRQLFSDGLVLYIPLGHGAIKSPINSIFGLLIASGMLCATGLAAKGPLRIGIDAAWAVEYRPGELYGSALAHAHMLESEVAKWPRVVVGEGLLGYLRHYIESAGSDISGQFRREMAKLCQGMISTDVDGQAFLHYLGSGFNKAAPAGMEGDVIHRAKQFIAAQLKRWEQEKNGVLAERYRVVSQYYEQHRPSD